MLAAPAGLDRAGSAGVRRRTAALLAAAALSILALQACAANPKVRYKFPPEEAPSAGTVVEGIASWYGPGFHGKRTASGERYDQNALTAAHPYWSFGTRVRVTLLSSGKSVVVRINDRFPSYKGRVIDVSRGTAKAIGLIGPGTGRVRLEVVR
jgi:peptidoglycan lytic transglycosylase